MILLPLVLAQFCLTRIPPTWQIDNATIFKLRQLKAFDEHWFNIAFSFTLTYLSQQPDYQKSLQQETDNMINDNENDLIPDIDKRLQDLSLFNEAQEQVESSVQEAQTIKQVTVSYKNNNVELRRLSSENEKLKISNGQLTERFDTLENKHNNLVTNIKSALDKRDNAIRNLLAQVKVLHQALQEIRKQSDPPQHFDD